MTYKILKDSFIDLIQKLDTNKDKSIDFLEYSAGFEKVVDEILLEDPDCISEWKLSEVADLKASMTYEKFLGWLKLYNTPAHHVNHDLILNSDFSANFDDIYRDIESWPEVNFLESQEIFIWLFNQKDPIKQNTIGDCYLISLFTAFHQNENFEKIIRDSFKFVKNPETQELACKVKIPLCASEEQASYVYFYSEDFLPIQNPDYAIDSNDVFTGRADQSDPRKEFVPAFGPQIFLILEASYAKQKAHLDQLTNPTTSLLYVDPFHSSIPETLSLLSADHIFAIEGGQASEAAEILFGADYIETEKVCLLTPDDTYKMTSTLDQYNPQKDMVCFWTGSSTDSAISFQVGEQTLYHSHEYALISTDPEKQTAVVIDPNNPNNPLTFTYDELLDGFAGFETIQFLENNS